MVEGREVGAVSNGILRLVQVTSQRPVFQRAAVNREGPVCMHACLSVCVHVSVHTLTHPDLIYVQGPVAE